MINPIRVLVITDTDIADILMNNFENIADMMNNLESENCTAGFITSGLIADGAITENKWGIEQIIYTAIGTLTATELQQSCIDFQNLDMTDITMPLVKVLFYTGIGTFDSNETTASGSRLITHRDLRQNGSLSPEFIMTYGFGNNRNMSMTFRGLGTSFVMGDIQAYDNTYTPGVTNGAIQVGGNQDVNASGEQFACLVIACPFIYASTLDDSTGVYFGNTGVFTAG